MPAASPATQGLAAQPGSAALQQAVAALIKSPARCGFHSAAAVCRCLRLQLRVIPCCMWTLVWSPPRAGRAGTSILAAAWASVQVGCSSRLILQGHGLEGIDSPGWPQLTAHGVCRRAPTEREHGADRLSAVQPANAQEAALLQSVAESRQWRVRLDGRQHALHSAWAVRSVAAAGRCRDTAAARHASAASWDDTGGISLALAGPAAAAAVHGPGCMHAWLAWEACWLAGSCEAQACSRISLRRFSWLLCAGPSAGQPGCACAEEGRAAAAVRRRVLRAQPGRLHQQPRQSSFPSR